MPTAERAFLARMRARVLTNDVLHEGLPVGRLLDVLLASNPTNQMAFEYAHGRRFAGPGFERKRSSTSGYSTTSITPESPGHTKRPCSSFRNSTGVRVELKGRAHPP